MLSIFSNFITKIIEVFLEDLLYTGDSFDECLHYLTLVLNHCIETNLVHVIVEHRVVLGHVMSCKELEVERLK